MQKVAVTEVSENGAAIPTGVLHALGVSTGDHVAFIENDDGSISLEKAPSPDSERRSFRDYIGIFATGEQRSIEQELALLRELRQGDAIENER